MFSLLLWVPLLKFVYLFILSSSSSSKSKTSNGLIGLPNHVSQGSDCQLRGQSCYVEVTLGCPRPGGDRALQSNSHSFRNLVKHQVAESPALGRGDQKGSLNNSTVYEKTFVYPAEAVLVPTLQFVRSSLKRYFNFLSQVLLQPWNWTFDVSLVQISCY